MLGERARREIGQLAADMGAAFAQPEYVSGCEVQDTTDKDLYATNNGWIEALCGRHNRQRCRWRGQFGDVKAGDFVDVLYFKSFGLFLVFWQSGTSEPTAPVIDDTSGDTVIDDTSGDIVYSG